MSITYAWSYIYKKFSSLTCLDWLKCFLIKFIKIDTQDVETWIKSRKIQNGLSWSSGNFKAVWQGESGELKTVCWFFKYCLLNFLNCFCVANCLIWLKVKKIEAYSSTFCSINALSINKDNPLLPLQSTTPVFVCQMRKSLKLSVRGEF